MIMMVINDNDDDNDQSLIINDQWLWLLGSYDGGGNNDNVKNKFDQWSVIMMVINDNDDDDKWLIQAMPIQDLMMISVTRRYRSDVR